MSENSELTNAAAIGAASAVAAVQDDQAEQERQLGMESATYEAAGAAELASEQATEAVQAATAAVEVATQASDEATQAASVAVEAAGAAYALESDVSSLRDGMATRDAEMLSAMRNLLDERFGTPEQRQEPREVVVTSNATDGTNSGQGNNTGSSDSTGATGERSENRSRHRWGNRR